MTGDFGGRFRIRVEKIENFEDVAPGFVLTGGLYVFRLKGVLDNSSSADLEERVLEVIEQGARFAIFDFKNVKHIPSIGLSVIAEVTERLEARDGILYLAAVNEHIQNILRLLSLDDVFPAFEDTDEAIRRICENYGTDSQNGTSAPDQVVLAE